MDDKSLRPSYWTRFKAIFSGSMGGFGGNWDAWGVSGRFGDVASAYGAYTANRMPSLGMTNFDYARYLGDGHGSSIIMACVFWLTGAFPEAPLVVYKVQADGEKIPQPKHRLPLLIKKPNPAYPGLLLWHATLADFLMTGNAYWWKRRDRQKRVVELWWLPSYLVDPRASMENPSIYIDHYAYTPSPKDDPVKLDPEDVVHFRQGLDPRNVRRGVSRLQSLFRDVFTDEEAGNYTAALLRNFALPGVIISPDVGEADIPQVEADRIKNDVKAKFTGDRRGEPIVVSQKIKVDRLSMNPAELDLAMLRRIPEERVCAIMGLSPMVVGLGAGLDRSTYSNYEEAREAAWENTLIPLQRLLSAELDTQLMVEFNDTDDYIVDFDRTEVTALQQLVDQHHGRVRSDLQAAVITLNQAKEAMKYKQIPDGDVYYLPSGVKVTEEDKLIEQAVTTPMTNAAMQAGIGPDGKPLPPKGPAGPGALDAGLAGGGPTGLPPKPVAPVSKPTPPASRPGSARPGATRPAAGGSPPPRPRRGGPLVTDVRGGRKSDDPDEDDSEMYESKAAEAEANDAPQDELSKRLEGIRQDALTSANDDLKAFLAAQRERVLQRLLAGLEPEPETGKSLGAEHRNGHTNGVAR